MAQSENGIAASKTDGEMPVVISRKNNMPTRDSLVVMKLSDWVNIYSEWLRSCGYETYDENEMQIEVTFDESLPSDVEPQDDMTAKVVPLFKTPRIIKTDKEGV